MSAHNSDIHPPIPPASAGRSIGVLLGCLFATGIAVGGANLLVAGIWPAAFDSTGRMTGTNTLIASLLLRTLMVVAGSYAAAALAPNRPREHALALGLILVGPIILFPVLRIAGKDMATGWYHGVNLVLTLPAARFGAALFERARVKDPQRPA